MSAPDDRIAVIITSYKPAPELWARCERLRNEGAEVVVVDNTPGGIDARSIPFAGVLLSDGVNKGLGKALNIGIRHALASDCRWLLLFDQDSAVPPRFCERMLQHFRELNVERQLDLAALAPTFVDDQTGTRLQSWRERLAGRAGGDFVCVNSLATSGMLIPAEKFRSVGDFSEKLFLDFVDFEWCWRAKRIGYALARSGRVTLTHRLGLGQRRVLGLTYHIPAEYRHYFQFRDTLYAFFGRVTPLYDRIRLLGLLAVKLIVYPWLLDRGLSRLHWMLLGIRDFLRRIDGIGAAYDKIGRAERL